MGWSANYWLDLSARVHELIKDFFGNLGLVLSERVISICSSPQGISHFLERLDEFLELLDAHSLELTSEKCASSVILHHKSGHNYLWSLAEAS